MADLDERFRSFSRTKTPDLWSEIAAREPGPSSAPSGRRRAIAIAVAFLVAASGLAVVAITFGGPEPRRSVGVPGTGAGNGAIAYVSDGDVWLVQPDGSDARKLTIDVPGFVGGLSWSPDGHRIVFDVNSYPEEGAPKGGFFDIYAANADGTGVVRLTHDRDARLPAWSPDGSRIAYTRQAGDGSQIYVMNADGSDPIALTSGSAFAVRPAWSPDGSRIAFESVAERNSDVYVMNADGSGLTRLTDDPAGDYNPVWSPDGEHIAFASDRSPSGIYVMRADGSDARLVEPDRDIANLGLAWSPDGRFLVFSSSRGEGFARAVYVLEVSSNAITQISDRGPIWGPSWQPAVASSAPQPSPSMSEPASVGVRVTTTRGVAEFPSAVAAGEGGVWVTAPRQDGSGAGDVIRLSPGAGEVVATIPVKAVPGWDFGGAGLHVGDAGVWTVGAFRNAAGCCDALVTRIDPATNSVVDAIAVPGLTEGDVWVDGSDVYVLGFTASEGGSSVPLELVKLDASDHTIKWRVPIPGQWSQTVFVADGSAWVLGTQPDARGPVEVDTLYRLDPETGTVLDQVPLPYATFGYIPAVSAETVWFQTKGGMQRFDAASASFIGEPVALGPGCCGGLFVSDGSGGVWVISSAEMDVDRSIWHLDASGAVVASGIVPDRMDFEDMQGQSYAFDPATQTIWVQHYENSVTRVEITVSGSAP